MSEAVENPFHAPLKRPEQREIEAALQSLDEASVVSGLGKIPPETDRQETNGEQPIVFSCPYWSGKGVVIDGLVSAAETKILKHLAKTARGEPIGERKKELDLERFTSIVYELAAKSRSRDLVLILPPYISEARADELDALHTRRNVRVETSIDLPIENTMQDAMGLALQARHSVRLRRNPGHAPTGFERCEAENGPWIYRTPRCLPGGVEVHRCPGNADEKKKRSEADAPEDFANFRFVIDWRLKAFHPETINPIFFR